MNLIVASVDAVRAALAPLTLKQLDRLAALSGVPVTTIYKIKLGTTENPGIETVRKIVPHISAASEVDPKPDAPVTGQGALDTAAAA